MFHSLIVLGKKLLMYDDVRMQGYVKEDYDVFDSTEEFGGQ